VGSNPVGSAQADAGAFAIGPQIDAGVPVGSSTRADASTPEGGTQFSACPPPPDAGGCPPPPDGGLEPYQSAASGTITGPNLNATLCNAAAYVEVAPGTSPPNELLFDLYSSGCTTETTFQAPPGAAYPELSVLLLVSTPTPGVYSITGGCGFSSFLYSLPIPPGIDCEGGSPQAASDCVGDSQTVEGSWTLTLTSVTPYEGDAGFSNSECRQFQALDRSDPIWPQ
jgi:hypothetical protein